MFVFTHRGFVRHNIHIRNIDDWLIDEVRYKPNRRDQDIEFRIGNEVRDTRMTAPPNVVMTMEIGATSLMTSRKCISQCRLRICTVRLRTFGGAMYGKGLDGCTVLYCRRWAAVDRYFGDY
jgi:hypothetical protein